MPPQHTVHRRLRIVATLLACTALANASAADAPQAQIQRWSRVLDDTPRACAGQATTPSSLNVETLQLRGDRLGNLFVATGGEGPGIVSYAAAGRERWRFGPCPDVPDPWLTQGWQILGSDERGGVWVRESRAHVVIDMQWSRLHHLDTHGQRTATIDPRVHAGYADVGSEIAAERARLVWIEQGPSDAQDLRRSIDFDTDGSIVARRDIVRGDDRVAFGRLLPQPQGEERMLGLNAVLRVPPDTYGDDIVLSRVRSGDVAEHIITLQMPFTSQALAPDGALWLTQYLRPLTLTRLTMDGAAATVDIAPALPDTYELAQFTRPLEQRFLLVGSGRVALVGTDGQLQRDLAIDATVSGAAVTSPFGWLLPFADAADGATAAVFAPDALTQRARFAVDLPLLAGTTATSARWNIADDGTVVALDQRTDPDGVTRTRVVGFAVPGSAASVRVLRDGFEP